MNSLKTSILALTEAIRSMGRQTTIPKAKNNGRKKSGKTRRGATHEHGKVFLGRRILAMTPAYYRRTHRGNPKKAAREKMLLEKRKWISE